VTQATSGIGDAAYYEQWYAGRTWEHYLPLVAQIIRLARPGPVLDVGAGPGLLLEALHRWGIPCTGMEASIAAVEIARERAPGLDMRCADASARLPFADASYETVVLNQVIEHVPADRHGALVVECLRLLRPGGLILVTSPSRWNRRERRADPTHIAMLSPAELRSLLRSSGFAEVRSTDAPFAFFGHSRVGWLAARALFKAMPLARLSATANAIGRAPGLTPHSPAER
jgi:SAM-dependent methyltransferase